MQPTEVKSRVEELINELLQLVNGSEILISYISNGSNSIIVKSNCVGCLINDTITTAMMNKLYEFTCANDMSGVIAHMRVEYLSSTKTKH